MKRLFIITLTIVCLGVHQETYAEIKNGYDNELKVTQQIIDNLHVIGKGTLNQEQQIKLKKYHY